eukprot:COSAG06_NODE_20052_length_811_cov_0.998596_2_plen_43_part_01
MRTSHCVSTVHQGNSRTTLERRVSSAVLGRILRSSLVVLSVTM